MRNFFERVVCADGFSMSVQASSGNYCSPRDDSGPWESVEVGFPSANDPLLAEFAEDPSAPIRDGQVQTVYGWVPMETIKAIIESHGGQVDGQLPSAAVPKVTRREHGRETEVAVLASPGFGAGWSTWNRGAEEVLMFHKDLVNRVLARTSDESDTEFEEDIQKILATLGIDIYMGGAAQLAVYWIEKGEEFIVNEYDGSESISLKSNFRWSVA